jgi:hypothetical protein
MRIQQIGFAVFDDAVRILEIGLPFANGLNFRASERDAGFEFVEQKVVMPAARFTAASRSPAATGSRGFAF